MDELRLPGTIRNKASITPGGEYAWRQADFEEAVGAARNAGLACLGGQVQFQAREGTCEAYWLKYDPEEQRTGEPWEDYVVRSSKETIDAFRQLCGQSDFRVVAREWELLRTKMDGEGYDPVSDLWFVLYFVKEPTD
jgi:hypothetical protein